MGELIVYSGHKVVAKGLDFRAKPQLKKIKKYLFKDEYVNLRLLKKAASTLNRTVRNEAKPLLLYPGCGTDIILPVLYLERLFPKMKEVDLLFVDVSNCFELIRGVLDDVGISFAESKENKITFYWNDLLINLEFKEGNIFQLLPNLPEFGIYFERAFRIMKDSNYESLIFQKLKPEGVIISDSGFQHLPLRRLPVSPDLSAYKEMIIGVKTTTEQKMKR